MWKKVHFITTILQQHKSIGQELADDFAAAYTFLESKLRQLGKEDIAGELEM